MPWDLFIFLNVFFFEISISFLLYSLVLSWSSSATIFSLPSISLRCLCWHGHNYINHLVYFIFFTPSLYLFYYYYFIIFFFLIHYLDKFFLFRQYRGLKTRWLRVKFGFDCSSGCRDSCCCSSYSCSIIEHSLGYTSCWAYNNMFLQLIKESFQRTYQQ